MTKEDVIATILATVSAWTGGHGNPGPLLSIAARESGFDPDARGDTGENGAAAKAWGREKPKFHGSTWADDDGRWQASLGLYQLMPANYLPIWDRMADPFVLLDPRVATVVAARALNRARRFGAFTVLDARMIWAFGPHGVLIAHNDTRYISRLASERARMRKLGLDPALATASLDSLGLDAFGTGPQEGQEGRVESIGGAVQPQKSGSPTLALAVLAALWGLSRV